MDISTFPYGGPGDIYYKDLDPTNKATVTKHLKIAGEIRHALAHDEVCGLTRKPACGGR